MPVHDKNGREMSDAEVQAVAKRWWDEYLEKCAEIARPLKDDLNAVQTAKGGKGADDEC